MPQWRTRRSQSHTRTHAPRQATKACLLPTTHVAVLVQRRSKYNDWYECPAAYGVLVLPATIATTALSISCSLHLHDMAGLERAATSNEQIGPTAVAL